MTKAILFDLFETLVTESQETPRRASSLGCDLEIEPEVFRVAWKTCRQAIILGQLSFSQGLAQIVAEVGRPVESSSLERLCQERVQAKALAFSRIETQILTVVRELRIRGIRLGVISNCFAEDVRASPTCLLSPLFACSLFSFQVHLAKPDPEIYQQACRQLAIDPAATLFVSDGKYDELKGAEKIGIKAFQALWYLKCWPNFCEDRPYVRTLSNIKDVLSLI
jgi:putative hydrolase of the HAD superfamily